MGVSASALIGFRQSNRSARVQSPEKCKREERRVSASNEGYKNESGQYRCRPCVRLPRIRGDVYVLLVEAQGKPGEGERDDEGNLLLLAQRECEPLRQHRADHRS